MGERAKCADARRFQRFGHNRWGMPCSAQGDEAGMSRFSIATLCLLVVGLLPPSANAGSNDAGLPDRNSAAPNVLNDSEKLGREVQRELARLGCFSGNVDEGWGREGRTAVKRLNQAAQIAWPDWPTADLVNSLRNYADGYCQKCRGGGEACATASAEPEKPPVASPVAKPPVEAKADVLPAPVATSVQKPPVAPPAKKTAAATPVDNHEPVNPPAGSRLAKTEPREIPEANAGNDMKLFKQEEDRGALVPLPTKKPAIPKVDDASASQPKLSVPHEQVVSAVPAAVPISEPVSAPPVQHIRGSVGGGGWPNGGPNLDGR